MQCYLSQTVSNYFKNGVLDIAGEVIQISVKLKHQDFSA